MQEHGNIAGHTRGLNMRIKTHYFGFALACTALSGCSANEAPQSPVIEKVASPKGKVWADVVSKTEASGYRIGNPDAKIKLVEFASLTCAHCAEFEHDSRADLREKFINTGQVSYEFINFVRDTQDMAGTLLAHCGPPEKFWAITGAILANQEMTYNKLKAVPESAMQTANNLPPEKRFAQIAKMGGLTELAIKNGLDPAAAQACLTNAANSGQIAVRVQRYLNDYKIEGTPAFYVNGEPVELNESSTIWRQLSDLLQESGAR